MTDRKRNHEEGESAALPERLAAEERIRAEREFTEVALDSQMDTFFLFDPESGTAIRWNKAFRDSSGYTDEEIARLPAPASYYSESDLERAEEFIRSVLDEGTGTIELDLICKDGRTIPTEYRVSMILDERGTPKHFISIGRDVTERKRVEQREREAVDRLRLAMESAEEGVWEWNFETGLVTFDAQSLRMLGYAPDFEPRSGEWWFEQVHPDDRLFVDQSFDALLSGKSGKYSVEFRLKRKDGGYRWVASTARVIRRDEDGNPVLVVGIHRDITDRKESDEALNESEKRFQYAMDATSDGLFDWNIRTKEIYFSPGYFTMLGYEPYELPHTFQTYLDLLHPDDAGRSKKMLTDYLSSGKGIRSIELRLRSKAGDWVWVLSRGKIVEYDDRGAPLRFVGTNINIDERKKAERTLDFERRKARQFLDVAGVMLVALDSDQKVTLINPKGCEVLGHPSEEIVGKNWFDHFLVSDEIEAVKSVYDRIIAGDLEQVEYFENFVRRKDGEKRLIAWHNSILRDKAGRIEGIFSSGEDITDRKQAEEELRNSERRYSLFVDGVNDGLWDWNIAAGELFLSPRWKSMLGYEVHEISNAYEEWESRLHPDDRERVLKVLDDYLAGRLDEYRVEHRIMHKDGEYRWILARGVCERDAEGRAIRMAGSHTDLTREKRTEEQLHQAQKMESIGRLAGGVAHDFNNLLTAIQGFAEIAYDSLNENDPIREDVAEVRKAARSATTLTQQLLAFSRRQIVSPKVVDLKGSVSRAEKMLKRIIGEDVDLLFVADENLAKVLIDPGQVDQILVNLAVNSRDALPKGGKLTIELKNVTLDMKKCQTCNRPVVGDFIRLAVSDNGSGIEPQMLKHIFEPFYTTKEKGKGTGLGLSTVHGVVHQNNGHIDVYSEPGQGTSVKIYLPALKDETEAVWKPGEGKRMEGDETIMVVEDLEIVRKLAVKTLKARGYRVFEAQHGGEALLACEELGGEIDLLLTDVVMPRMSGRQLYKRLLKINPTLKALFMSGYTDDAIAHHGVLDEGINFIQKPFLPVELVRKVGEVLDQ